MGKVRFGLVGCGFIGLAHAWAISSLDDAELVGVMDTREESAREVGERFEASWYTDYNSLLSRDDIDAIAIVTPSGLHAEQAIMAARAGKHVMVEKPMAITLEQANRTIEECKKSSVKLGCIFQERFCESSQLLKKAAKEDRFGALVLGDVYVKWYRYQKYYDTSGGWRGTWKYDGGGALINQSIHTIDLLCWVMGPVKRIYGRTATRTHNIETEDVGIASLEFANGALGVIEGTTSAYPGLFSRLEIHGDKGSAVIENRVIKTWRFAEKKEGDPEEEKVPDGELIGASPSVGVVLEGRDPSKIGVQHRVQYNDYVKAILEDREPLVNGKEGKKALEVVLGIYRSVQDKIDIELPLSD